MKKNEIEKRLWTTLPGPWSWSDLLDHLALGVAYGIVRSPSSNREERGGEITDYIRDQALRIVGDDDDEEEN